MAGFNTNEAYSKMFQEVDPVVLQPKKDDLLGRTMFQVTHLTDQWANTWTWSWKERMGQASDYANRATDTTTMDVNYHEEIGYVTSKSAAFEYSQEDLERSAEGHYDIVTDRAQATHDALADWEDRVIFNGIDDSKRPIYGLTTDASKVGYQTMKDDEKAPVTIQSVVDPANTNAYADAFKLINWFKDAAAKITLLPGYHNSKPTLALPSREYNLLTRPLMNQYSPDKTLWGMIQSTQDGNQPTFADIKCVPELEAQYWNTQSGKAGKQNMGIVYLDTPDVARVVVAMEPRRMGPVAPDGMKYKQFYLERMGGLDVRFPAGIVQLSGLNDGSEKWAKAMPNSNR